MTSEMHKILIFLKRRPGLSLEEFRDYYESRHVPLCMKYMAGARRYLRRYVQTQADAAGNPRELDFDVITELWFNDRAAFETALKFVGRGILPKEIIADEEQFLDRSKTKFIWVTEFETDLRVLAPP